MPKLNFRVIDSDMHTMEPDDLWERFLDEPFKKFMPRVDPGSTASKPQLPGRAAAEKEQSNIHPHYGVARKRGYDSESHLQAMDIEGIDIAILYGTRGRHLQMRDDLDPEFAAALARAHNNWTGDYCTTNPERLKFAAQISFHDVGLAVREARRAVRELGAVAIICNPNPVNGRHIHDAYFDPLWDALEEAGVPATFHPTGVWTLSENIARRFLGHSNESLLGTAAHNPLETMLGFGSLAMGGVFDRHPKLQCAFLEGNCGWLPWWLWRLDETITKFGYDDEMQLSALPSEYFHRHCYIATEPDEPSLRDVIEQVGENNIVFASDYPHRDGLFPEAVNSFVHQRGLTDETKTKILWDNSARLYNLSTPNR